jgi:prophage regulatory protein
MSSFELNLVGLKRVRELTSLGKSTIYRLISENKFPRPVKLTERRVAWRASDLTEWLQDRVN